MNILKNDTQQVKCNYTSRNGQHVAQVIDNFLSESDFVTLKSIIIKYLTNDLHEKEYTKENRIVYCHSSVGYAFDFTLHWSVGITQEVFLNTNVLKHIQDSFDTKNKELKIKRIYCSFQSWNHFGNWHCDDNQDGTYTFVTYVDISPEIFNCRNQEVHSEILNEVHQNESNKNEGSLLDILNKTDKGGYFYLKFPGDDEINFFPFNENRGIFFGSKLLHNGDCFRNNEKSMRCVVAFKLFT
jgi:hypothetical protein